MGGLSVKIPREIMSYQSKIIAGLTLRQLICFSICGIIGIPIYLCVRDYSQSLAGWLLMLVSVVPFSFAVIRKNDQPLEVYLKAWIHRNIKTSKVRIYQTETVYKKLVEADQPDNAMELPQEDAS